MKNHKLPGQIILFIGFSLLFSFLFLSKLYFSAILAVIFLVKTGFMIYEDQCKTVKRIENMIANIHYGDLNISFPGPLKGIEAELTQAMNEALSVFRKRLYGSVVAETENEAWQKLIRVLTHEIMNSMAPIISLSETVTERTSTGEMNEKEYKVLVQSIRTIHKRSKGLLDFVENYRKLTRIPKPEKSNFPIRDLFSHMLDLFPAEQLQLKVRVEPKNLILYADPTLIEQVLINLVKNSYEASPTGSRPLIFLESFSLKNKIVIKITDQGYGIIPEALDKIFVPFFTTKPNGSGIGLAICRQIIIRHGGIITVDSEIDRGTTFTIELPGMF